MGNKASTTQGKRCQVVETRRWLNKEQKLEVAKKIMDMVGTGVSRSRAAEIVHGCSFQQIERWAYSDEKIWKVLNENPYPYEPTIKHKSVIPWAIAAQYLKEGKVVRHHESRLYRYRMNGGRLIEIRRCLETGKWYEADELSLPLETFFRWRYEVVE